MTISPEGLARVGPVITSKNVCQVPT